MRTINIWCDASQRKVDRTKQNPRGRKISFTAWVADTGHYWYDQVYAKNSHDAEVTAVLVALNWALEKEYEVINLYTDDKSIPESLNGKYQGRKLGDLSQVIKENTAEINIIPIPRKQNKAAHDICNEAYRQFTDEDSFQKRVKKSRSYYKQDAILRAKKNGWMKAVYDPFEIDQATSGSILPKNNENTYCLDHELS